MDQEAAENAALECQDTRPLAGTINIDIDGSSGDLHEDGDVYDSEEQGCTDENDDDHDMDPLNGSGDNIGDPDEYDEEYD